MKITYFIDHLRPDGAQFVLCQVVEGMAERGHEQHVICLNDTIDPFIFNRINASADNMIVVGKKAVLSGAGWVSAWKELNRFKPDVVVTMLFVSDILGRITGKLAGTPRIVSSIQTHDIFYTPLQRWAERRTAFLTDVALTNSDHYLEFVVEQEGIPISKIKTIYNSIDPDNYLTAISRSHFCHELGIKEETKLIGFAGRLAYQKGLDVLLEAIASLTDLDYVLWIAGVGEEENHLRKLAADLGIDERVIFAGYRREIPHVIGALDLYVQPSRYEGMPISVLEAMAAGCPIVATAVDGNCELIEHGVSGWLCPSEDPQKLADVMRQALSNPREAKSRGTAARQRVYDRFNSKVILDAWEEAFRG